MQRKQQKTTWVLEDLAGLTDFSDQFRAYCVQQDLDEGKIFELELSLEELIVNSFNHGYKDHEQGTVTIEAEDNSTEVRISLQDNAPPFDLFRDAPPPRLGGKTPEPEPEPSSKTTKELEQEKEGGLGIHLVKSLNDKVEYYGSKDGNIVVIIKSKS